MVADAPSRLRRFVVELDPALGRLGEPEALTTRARSACRESDPEGNRVRFLRAIFLPDDGSMLMIFDASSEAALDAAVKRAELALTGISELGRQ